MPEYHYVVCIRKKSQGTSYQGSIKSQVSSSYILMSAISQDQVFTIQPEQRNKYNTFDIYQWSDYIILGWQKEGLQ